MMSPRGLLGFVKDFACPCLPAFQDWIFSMVSRHIKVCQGGDKLLLYSRTRYMPSVGMEPLSSPSQFSFAEAVLFYEAQSLLKFHPCFAQFTRCFFLLLTLLHLPVSREMTASLWIQQASVLHYPQILRRIRVSATLTCYSHTS